MGGHEEQMMGDWMETLIAAGRGCRRWRWPAPAFARQADAKRSCVFLRVLPVLFSSVGFGRLANIGPLEVCRWTASATYENFARQIYRLVEEPAPPAI